MKKFLLIIALLLLPASNANEDVFLDVSEYHELKVPDTFFLMLEREKELRESFSNSNDDGYFDAEESLFDNKVGKKFEKFVNEVVINNKLNQSMNKSGLYNTK